MIEEIEKNKCTGCQMCADVCPTKAITYKTDTEGFWYPSVDVEKCIHCNKCTRVCPSLNNPKIKKEYPKVYKTWIKNKDIRLKSTSGGIYYALAFPVIERGGYLVGSIYRR